MAVVLAYVDAVPGRLYPLVPTLLELVRRDHRVAGAERVARAFASAGGPARAADALEELAGDPIL